MKITQVRVVDEPVFDRYRVEYKDNRWWRRRGWVHWITMRYHVDYNTNTCYPEKTLDQAVKEAKALLHGRVVYEEKK